MKKLIFYILILFFYINILPGQDYIAHEVKDGETLWRISKNYKVSFDEILKINKIEDVEKIKAGTIIKIPKNSLDNINKEDEKNKDKNVNYKIHNLKKNETLWSLSKKYNVSVDELCAINKISDITKIKKNAKIKIPVKLEFIELALPIKNGEILKSSTAHFNGIYIFSENENENIFAVDKGIVSFIDNISGYGITLFIRHENGFVSMYAGFKEIYIRQGESIKQSQLLGKAGRIRRYDRFGILFSVQYKGTTLEFSKEDEKFIKPSI